MEKLFFDRCIETEKLNNLIRDKKKDIIIIIGESGVGKTELTKQVINSDNIKNMMIVRVKMPKRSNNTITNLLYFNKLYNEVKNLAETNMFDSILSPTQYMLKDKKNYVNVIRDILKNKIGISEKTSLSLDSDVEQNISLKQEYILYNINSTKSVIVIENSQNLDVESYDLILDLIRRSDFGIFVFEYTSSNFKDDSEYMNFYSDLRSLDVPIHNLYLNMLPFKEALNLVPNECKKTKQQIHKLRKIYLENQGNLLQMILANVESIKKKNQIEEAMINTSYSEKYILFILYLYEDPISILDLYLIIFQENNHSSKKIIDNSIYNLVYNKKLLKLENDHVSIHHDSLIKEIEELPITPTLFTAYGSLKEFLLNSINEESTPNMNKIMHLFSIYIKFSDNELIDILPYIKKLIYQLKYPHTILNIMRKLEKKLIDNNSLNLCYELYLFCTEICIYIEDKEQAQSNLDHIYNKANPFLVALQGEILSLGNSKEDIESLNVMIRKCNNLRLELILNLCKLHLMMKIKSYKESFNFAEELRVNETYQSLPEYGYVLSNRAELSTNIKESISFYLESNKIFKKFSDNYSIAKSYISLCMEYGYYGDVNKARECLSHAKEISPDGLKESYFLNNMAVLDILSLSQTQNTIENLLQALLLTSNDYEQILIRSNLMVCYILENKSLLAQEQCNYLEQSGYEKYNYEEFLHIIYQNLYYFYTTYSNYEEAGKYQLKIEEMISKKDIGEHTKKLAAMMLKKEYHEDIFYSRFPFRVDFLAYWGSEVKRDLENS